MTHTDPDEQLRELLTDAVSDIEPGHRLSEIRARTAQPQRRSRWSVAGGAVLATAAAVATFAVLTDLGGTPDNDEVVQEPETRAAPAYFVGDTPDGQKLFREFIAIDAGLPALEASLTALERGPDDPDYTTLWEPDSFADATMDGEVIVIDLADEALIERPPGMSAKQAELAVWQVIYSAQAALGGGRKPVQFRLNGNPTNEVYGEELGDEPVGNRPRFDLRALVSISDPTERQVVSGTFRARGVGSSFEGTVPLEIRDADGAIVLETYANTEGWGPNLAEWKTEIDVSGLEPGTYLFVASTSDPSGGAEGAGATSDTRTIVVE